MIRSVFFILFFWIFLLSTLVLLPPYLLLFPFRRARERYIRWAAKMWSRNILRAGGVRVKVEGLAHLPADNRMCIISNHQSNFDIPILEATLPMTVGFISKKELLYVPILNIWMLAVHCVFLDRRNARSSARAIEKAARKIRHGCPVVVFPEGTRSRGPTMGPFHRGSFKLAVRSGAPIVPVTISGSYRLFEERRRFCAGHVRLTIHPPFDIEGMTARDTGRIAEGVRHTIQSAL